MEYVGWNTWVLSKGLQLTNKSKKLQDNSWPHASRASSACADLEREWEVGKQGSEEERRTDRFSYMLKHLEVSCL